MKSKPLLKTIVAMTTFMTATSLSSQPEMTTANNKVDLVNGMYISEPSDFIFETSGSRKYGLPGMGGRAGNITEILWTVKKDGLFLSLYYYYIPGRPQKNQQTIQFIDENNLSVINYHMKKYSEDAVAAGSDPEKIANGGVRGYISTAKAKPESKFAVTFRQTNVGNYSCVTEAVLNRQSQGTLAKKVERFIAIVASDNCESSNHKKAITALKSITG